MFYVLSLFCFFEAGRYCVALAGLELPMETRLPTTQRLSCLCPSGAGTEGVCHCPSPGSNKYINVPSYKFNIIKQRTFIYTSNLLSEKLEKYIPFKIMPHKICLRNYLAKEVNDLFNKNFKRFTKFQKILDNENRFWIGRINFVQMDILSKLIYKINVVSRLSTQKKSTNFLCCVSQL